MKKLHKIFLIIVSLGFIVGAYYAPNGSPVVSVGYASEADKGELLISPTEARDRDFYSPNSETLNPDEMRVIACGTGMPTPRPAQAAACFLVELGNGEKFLFDIGDGSVERLFGLQIPTAFLDKVFIRAFARRSFWWDWCALCCWRYCWSFHASPNLGTKWFQG